MARPITIDGGIRKSYYLGRIHRKIIENRAAEEELSEGEALRRIVAESQNLETPAEARSDS